MAMEKNKKQEKPKADPYKDAEWITIGDGRIRVKIVKDGSSFGDIYWACGMLAWLKGQTGKK